METPGPPGHWGPLTVSIQVPWLRYQSWSRGSRAGRVPWGNLWESLKAASGTQIPVELLCKPECGLAAPWPLARLRSGRGGWKESRLWQERSTLPAVFARLCRGDASQLLAWGSSEGWATPWDTCKATGNLLYVGFQPTHGQTVTHEPPAAAETAKHGAPACLEPTGLLLLPGPQFPEMLEPPPQGKCKAAVALEPAQCVCGAVHCHTGAQVSI